MKNQTVLIVGAGGIGAASARLFSRAGANVVISSRSKAKAETLAAELNASDGNAYAIEADVTDPASVAALADTVQRELGSIDVLVNAFGVGMIQPLAESDPASIKALMDVNVNGTIFTTQAVLRHMVAAKKGTIILIPGILGKHVMKNSSIYSASKFAVSGFAKALVEEHRRNGIKVSLLYLGGVATPFWENPEIGMRVQADKMLTADEVAKAIYYACSQPESSVLNEIVMQPESHQLI
jgi:NADP-dependent 3-hydroxy acid dehydrogenase YdfG